MNYYTSTIPLPLAEKLKEKGMPIILWDEVGKDGHYPTFYCKNTFAEVFDWLMEKGKRVYITRAKSSVEYWHGRVNDDGNSKWYTTWHEAAEKAIETALKLI